MLAYSKKHVKLWLQQLLFLVIGLIKTIYKLYCKMSGELCMINSDTLC